MHVKPSPSSATQLANYRPQLFAHALKRLRNHADAEDLVQDVLLRALDYADTHDGLPDKLEHWLHKVLFRASVDFMRLARHRVDRTGDDVFWAMLGEGHGTTPNHDLRLDLGHAIGRLQPSDMDMFVHIDVLGHTTKDLAQQRSVPLGTMLGQAIRVRTRLRAMLEPA